MLTFKEQLEKDFDTTFFNLGEFAEIHEIDGKGVLVVVDNDKIIELDLGKMADTDGVFTDSKIFYVQKKDMEYEPVPGQIMNFDGEDYPILNVLEDMGGYTIILKGNQD